MISQRFGHALAAAVFVLSVGCGDDGDGGGGSGVDSSKTGDELSDAEATKLCESTESKGADIELDDMQFCVIGVTVQSMDKATCEQTVMQACADDDGGDGDTTDDNTDEDDDDDCADAKGDLEGCTATVGEIEECFDALLDWANKLDGISCDDAGKVTQDSLAIPEKCATVQQKCPKLLGDVEDDMNAGN
jgi:hypothetical protein